jgi:microspherule protein 1
MCIQVGAAVEALAKGAVKFSRRYTVQELRARWRALLYDPVISQEAALRMMKSDACLPNPTKLTNLNRLKYPQVSNKKRKLKSVRASYYKMRKKMAAELNTNPSVLKVEADTVESLPGKCS